MKIRRDNTIKLDANEKRVGNFVVRLEKEHVKVSDINNVFSHRANVTTPVGQFIAGCYAALETDESTGKGLANWLAVIFTAFSVVPDIQFLEEVMKASTDCMERHPEAYGLPKQDVSDEKDAEIIQEERELTEFEDEVRQMPDKPAEK